MRKKPFSTQELKKMLSSELKKYPDESIEMGENWQLLAKIFHDLGFEAAKKAFLPGGLFTKVKK